MMDDRIPSIRQQQSQKDEDKMGDDSKPMQYQSVGGVSVRCGRTHSKLSPGFYDVVNTGPATGYGLKPKAPVTDDLIDIPGTVADEVFEDIEKFMRMGPQYTEFGLTHKRGYLFYGPPGSGKTSLAAMLANRFIKKVGGIVMYCGDVGSFYHGSAVMRDIEPGRPSMYLIEEADTIVNNTHCLQILDGELSIQGAVFVAMTNYKEKLPPRIANRPGRFDRVIQVACPPTAVQLEYLKRVASRSKCDQGAPEKIVKMAAGLSISMAHLREAFIAHVLMGTPLATLRRRFETMSGVRDENGKLVEGAVEHVVEDDDREDRIWEAKNWSPDQ